MEITADFLENALQSLKEEIFSSLHVAMPGIIRSYDPERRTATVQPALRRKNAAGEIITADAYLGKTIDVRGIVDYFAGEYQIKVFSANGITVYN